MGITLCGAHFYIRVFFDQLSSVIHQSGFSETVMLEPKHQQVHRPNTHEEGLINVLT